MARPVQQDARLVSPDDLRVAYVLYEKGHTLLSVFLVSGARREAQLTGLSYLGRDYVVAERTGHRLVAWTEGSAILGLISTLDEKAMLECGAHLRADPEARLVL